MKDMTAEPQDLADGLRSRLDALEKRLADLWDQVDEVRGHVQDRMKPFLDEFERSVRSVRSTVYKVAESAGDSGRELAGDVRTEIDGLQDEVTAASQELREELASSRKDFCDAAQKELDAWRGRLDHLRVQADLGRMETRDEVERLRDNAEVALREARAHLDQIADLGEETLDTIRSRTTVVLDDLRKAVRDLRDRERRAA